MPNFVAIELNENVMVVACAKGTGKNFQINHLFEIAVADLSSDAERGTALKDALAERSVTKSELIGVVNRKQVEMREVSVPPAPDNELPDLVRFQARNVFASMNDSWKLDYVPFAKSPDATDDDEQARVLAISIPPTLHDQYSEIAEAAGIKLKRIVFGPYSCCSLYEALMNDDTNRMLIVPAAGHFDFTVASGTDLIATRSVKASEDSASSARQMVGEVRRTLASTKSILRQKAVEQILIGASEQQFGEIGTEITNSLELPVSYLDVFTTLPGRQLAAAKPEHPEHFSAVIGTLAREYSSKKQAVDFVNPRKPVIRKLDYKPVLIGAAALALLMLMVGIYGWMSLGSLQSKLDSKQTELNKLKRENEGNGNQMGIDDTVSEVELLDKWEYSRTNWPKELKTLSELMKTPDDILVTSFQGQPSKDSTVKLFLKIRTTEETNAKSDWIQSLFDHYEVTNGPSKPGAKQSDYPFESELTLTKKPDEEALLARVRDEANRRLDGENGVAEMPEPDGDQPPASPAPQTPASE